MPLPQTVTATGNLNKHHIAQPFLLGFSSHFLHFPTCLSFLPSYPTSEMPQRKWKYTNPGLFGTRLHEAARKHYHLQPDLKRG